MVYLIAVVMGYVITQNMRLARSSQQFIGMGTANPTANLLLSLGGLAGWFCILPAAYFVGHAEDNGLWQGVLFAFASLFGGGILAGVVRLRGLDQLIAYLALPINVSLAVLVYVLTR